MKGQNLAVETVFTVGLGIAVATGIVTVFNQYNTDVSDEAMQKQSQVTASEIKNSIYSLESAQTGEVSVDLPEEMGSNSYRIELGEDISIISNGVEKEYSLDGVNGRLEVSGSAPGGDVKLFKSGREISIVED